MSEPTLDEKYLSHHCYYCNAYWETGENPYFDKWNCCGIQCMAELNGVA